MSSPLHTEIKALAGANPAAYIRVDLVSSRTLDRTAKAIQALKGAEIPVGQHILSASLQDAKFIWQTGSKPVFAAHPTDPHRILLKISAALSVRVNIFPATHSADVISVVTAEISDIELGGSYSSDSLIFEGVDFKIVKIDPVRTPNADTIIRTIGIDPIEVTRIEGLIAYGSVTSAITDTLGQKRLYPLQDLYPAYSFGTSAKLLPLQHGDFMAIVPNEIKVNASARCECAVGPDLSVSVSTTAIDSSTIPPDPKPNTAIGSATFGGPIAEKIDPLKDLGRRYPGTGLAGMYLSQTAYQALTYKVMPAISISAEDDGFIGFNANASVGFSSPKIDVDAPNGGILASVDMDISVTATCMMKLVCVRVPIGYAIIRQATGSSANLKMGFYPAIDSAGNVKLRAVLKDVDMGSYVVVILGVGTALKIIGVTAWIGFLVDVVLSAIVSYKLPSVLRDEVKKYLGQNEWVLLQMGDVLHERFPARTYPFSAPFDVDGHTACEC